MADQKKVIRFNYKAYLADIDKLYDTTDEQAAKDAGIYDEKSSYAPMAYIAGSKRLFPAFDEALLNAKIGEEFTVEIPCEEGLGVKNPKLIETHPIKEFYRQEINPYPGLTVALAGRTGTVLSVGAGRVKIDFNSPLAGHDLKYVATVTEEITDNTEKAKAIIEANFATSDEFKFDFPGEKVVVTLPDIVKFNKDWPVARFKIVNDLREAFAVDTVEFVEVWSVAKKEEPKTE